MASPKSYHSFSRSLTLHAGVTSFLRGERYQYCSDFIYCARWPSSVSYTHLYDTAHREGIAVALSGDKTGCGGVALLLALEVGIKLTVKALMPCRAQKINFITSHIYIDNTCRLCSVKYKQVSDVYKRQVEINSFFIRSLSFISCAILFMDSQS